MTKLTVRERQRRQRHDYVEEAQGYDVWTEYQVIYNRKIIRRCDLEEQAHQFVADYQAYLRGERDKP